MTSSPASAPFFRRIAIEAFRGFNHLKEINLDASAIVVWGANGRGKTSLADAIQWLILGKLPRFAPLRLHQNDEHIVNAYAALEGRKARVSAELFDASRVITITRYGDYRQSTLEFKSESESYVGDEAETRLRLLFCGQDLDAKSFERYVLSMALLQQDVIRAFLSDEKPDERYALLTRLLGLEALDDFTDALEKSAAALKTRRDALASSVAAVNRDLEDTASKQAEVKARIDTTEGYETPEEILQVLSSEDSILAEWARTKLTSAQRVDDIFADLQLLEGDLSGLSRSSQLPSAPVPRTTRNVSEIEPLLTQLSAQDAELQTRLEGLERDLLDANQVFAQAIEHSQAVERLVAAALPLLSNTCPVCGQDIEKDEVESHLRASLQGPSNLPDLSARRDAITGELQLAREARLGLQREQQVLGTERLVALQQDAEARQRTNLRNTLLARISALSISPPVLGGTEEVIEGALGNWALSAQGAVRLALSAFQRANAKGQVTGFQVELSNLERLLSQLTTDLRAKELELRSMDSSLAARNDLVRLAKEASTEVVTDTFEEIKPVVQDVFSRLSPHPTFARLSLTNEVYRRHGTTMPAAFDEVNGLELSISPALGFSSAQANVAALCYFVAFAFSGKEISFPLVFMDDPLQSMDDVNTLGFADLCRFLRREKQMIVSTHDDRLSSLLIRKLTPRFEASRIISLHFNAWDRNGPLIEETVIEAENPSRLFSHAAQN